MELAGRRKLNRMGQVRSNHPAAQLQGQFLPAGAARSEGGPILPWDPNNHYSAARADGSDGVIESLIRSRDLERDVYFLLPNELARGRHVGPGVGVDHEGCRGSHRPSCGDPMLKPVCGNDGRGTAQTQELDKQQADGPAPVYADSGSGTDRRKVERV